MQIKSKLPAVDFFVHGLSVHTQSPVLLLSIVISLSHSTLLTLGQIGPKHQNSGINALLAEKYISDFLAHLKMICILCCKITIFYFFLLSVEINGAVIQHFFPFFFTISLIEIGKLSLSRSITAVQWKCKVLTIVWQLKPSRGSEQTFERIDSLGIYCGDDLYGKDGVSPVCFISFASGHRPPPCVKEYSYCIFQFTKSWDWK